MPSADEFTAALGQAGPQERVLQQLCSALPVQAFLKPPLCKRAQSSSLPLCGAGGAQPAMEVMDEWRRGGSRGGGHLRRSCPPAPLGPGGCIILGTLWGLGAARASPALLLTECHLPQVVCSSPLCSASRKALGSPQEAFVHVLHHQ